jgi:hypothetical protein
VRVHLAVEHPLELKLAHFSFQTLRLALDIAGRGLITFRFREVEQFAGLSDTAAGTVDDLQLGGQTRTLLAQLLRLRGILPDRRVLKLQSYLFQPLFFSVVLKETPEESRSAPLGL